MRSVAGTFLSLLVLLSVGCSSKESGGCGNDFKAADVEQVLRDSHLPVYRETQFDGVKTLAGVFSVTDVDPSLTVTVTVYSSKADADSFVGASGARANRDGDAATAFSNGIAQRGNVVIDTDDNAVSTSMLRRLHEMMNQLSCR